MTRKYGLLYIFIPILIMFLILTLHTFTNEQKIAEPPNKNWSHPITLQSIQKSAPPFLKVNEKNQVEAWIAEKHLERTTIEDGEIINQEIIKSDGFNFNESAKFQLIDDLIVVLNKEQLQIGMVNQNKIEAIPLSLNQVIGYDWLTADNKNYLLVSTRGQLQIYEYQNTNFELLGSYDGFPVSSYLKGIYSNNEIKIYAFSKPDYTIEYYNTAFSLEKLEWENPKKLYSEVRLESMFDVSNVNFVPHDEEIRIYMITKKRMKTEMKRQIEMVVFDRSTDQIKGKRVVIENPVLFGRETSNTEFLQLKTSEEDVDIFIATSLAGKGRESSNYKIVELAINNGEVKDYQFLSKGSTYSKYPYYLQTKTGDYVTWLEITSTGYQLVLSSDNDSFKAVANQKMEGNWALAIGYTFQDSWIVMLSMLKGLIWLLAPLLLLVGLSIFTSTGWMDKRYRWIILVASILFISIQIFDINYFYKPSIVPYMPGWLTFTGSKIIIPLTIAISLIYPTWAFMKRIELPSPFLSFFYFTLVDLMIINLIFSPYMIF